MFRQKNGQQQPSQKPDASHNREELSDEQLMAAITNGSIWALEMLYERYHHMLYSLAYRIVTDYQIAEDLLQEAILSVWRRGSTYTPQAGSVRSWLFSIVHHRAIDYIRTAQRRASLNKVTLEEVEHDLRAAYPDVWEEAWRAAQGFQIREALMRLPKEQRMVIELAYFQGWTHVEIAEGCQLPLGTVKARMRLGLQHMRQILRQMGIDER